MLKDNSREAGKQPLDQLMIKENFRNNDLVSLSEEGLTHKQVSKAERDVKLQKNCS